MSPVIVTWNGKPVGGLLSVEDEEELERLLLAYSPRFRKILLAARNQIEAPRPQDGASRKGIII